MELTPELLTSIAIGSIAIIAALIIFNYISDIKKMTQNEEADREIFEEGKKNINSNDIGVTMKNFYERRKLLNSYYYSILKKVNISFNISVLMAIIGFVIIIYQTFITLNHYENNLNYIKLVSSIVIEAVSVLFVRVFKNISKKSDKIIIEITDSDKLITRIDLINKLPKDKQDDLIVEIIKELKN